MGLQQTTILNTVHMRNFCKSSLASHQYQERLRSAPRELSGWGAMGGWWIKQEQLLSIIFCNWQQLQVQ